MDGNGIGGQTLASLFSSLRTEDQTGGKRLKKWDSQQVSHPMRPKRAPDTSRAFTTELIGVGQCKSKKARLWLITGSLSKKYQKQEVLYKSLAIVMSKMR